MTNCSPNSSLGLQKNFIISDSSYRKTNQQDIGPLTAIHSYSSATINDVNNIVDKYTYEPKVETRVMHVGHKSIDEGLTGKESKYLQNNSCENFFLAEIKTTLQKNIFNDALDNVFGKGWYISLVKT